MAIWKPAPGWIPGDAIPASSPLNGQVPRATGLPANPGYDRTPTPQGPQVGGHSPFTPSHGGRGKVYPYVASDPLTGAGEYLAGSMTEQDYPWVSILGAGHHAYRDYLGARGNVVTPTGTVGDTVVLNDPRIAVSPPTRFYLTGDLYLPWPIPENPNTPGFPLPIDYTIGIDGAQTFHIYATYAGDPPDRTFFYSLTTYIAPPPAYQYYTVEHGGHFVFTMTDDSLTFDGLPYIGSGYDGVTSPTHLGFPTIYLAVGGGATNGLAYAYLRNITMWFGPVV